MDLRCPKCGAGFASLYRHRFVTQDGTRMEAVSCRSCSHELASRETGKVLQSEKAAEEVAQSIQFSKENPCNWKAAQEKLQEQKETCPVPGCEDTFSPKRSKFGLCKKHSKRLGGWIGHTLHKKTPPVLKVNGVWIERGQALPAIPGERPAPPPKAKAAPKPRAKRSPRAHRPPPVNPMRAQLEQLARRGYGASAALLAKLT